MKRSIIATILIAMTLFAYCQTPEWIDLSLRKKAYPSLSYYTSFIENSFDRKQNAEELIPEMKNRASLLLSSGIKVTVEGLTSNVIEENNTEYQTYFKQASTSYTNVELIGLKYETYIDEKDRKVYVLAYVKKKSLNDFYFNQLKEKVTSLQQQINKANQFIKSANQTEAQKVYLAALPVSKECESQQSLLMAIGRTPVEKLFINEIRDINKQLDNIQVALKSTENRSVNDLGNFIGQALGEKLPKNTSLKISYITYGDTKMSSLFSKRFSTALTESLTSSGNHNIVKEPKSNTIIIKGTYWEDGNNIRVSIIASDFNGKVVAASSDMISKSYLTQSNIAYKAENFEEAYSRLKEFRKDEVVNGDLSAEVWTNKGSDNLLFEEGEIMKLFVRVNMPSYVRVIYFMADGSQVLLLDNYYIDQTKVNKVIEIPDEFECAEPFGYETMQISARTQPFNALPTEKKWGYDFIIGETKAVVKNTRGFKKVTNKDKSAEMRLNFTTMKK